MEKSKYKLLESTIVKTRLLFGFGVFISLTAGHGFAGQAENAEWGPVTNGFQMSATLMNGKEPLGTNQPVRLMLLIKNVSSNETCMIKRQARTFYYIVSSPSGRDSSPKRAPDTYWGSRMSIAPGMTEQFPRELSKDVKFDEVGTYKITAKAEVSKLKNRKTLETFEIISNPVSVSLKPDRK